MKSTLKILLLASMTVWFTYLTSSVAFAGNTFTDIDENYPYLPAIRYLKETGVIKGYPDGSFRPNNEINRAEALKIITLSRKILGEKMASEDAERLLDQEAIQATMDTDATSMVRFDLVDVPGDSWYQKYVIKAFNDGIIKGYADRTFKPGNTIQQAEALKMLFEANHVEIPDAVTKKPFRDVEMDAWYAPYMKVAKDLYMVIADMNLNALPEENLSRKELANIIYRYYNLDKGKTYGRASYYADYFQGKGTASGEKFDQNLYTAAHLTLPFGSLIKVVNTENEKSVIVRVNDRGPYDERFVLDLSKTAFETISPLSRGVIQIYYEIISTP